MHTSTRTTPFSLVYGMEVVLPFEVEIPSLRVLLEAKLEEVEWVQAHFDQLNIIEEKEIGCYESWAVVSEKNEECFRQKGVPM